MPTFRFVQFEYPWPLGPADGRYVVRDTPEAEPHTIVVIATLAAPQRRERPGRRRGRRGRQQQADPAPAAVATGRATIIDASALEQPAAAAAWLRALEPEAELESALRTLNRVLQAHRIATADPHVHEVAAGAALVIRAGFGDGEHVAEGRWQEAVELATPQTRRRRRRAAVLRPQERLAALLGARDAELASEELALRARADLDHDRVAAGALTTRLALDAALVELAPLAGEADIGDRLGELRELRDGVLAAASTALSAPLAAEQLETVAHALARIEAALRARTAASLS